MKWPTRQPKLPDPNVEQVGFKLPTEAELAARGKRWVTVEVKRDGYTLRLTPLKKETQA